MGPKHADDFTRLDGIRCTGIARTLCDLGSVDPRDQVKAAFESVWRRGVSLLWLRGHRAVAPPGQRGTGVLMSLLDEAVTHRTPTESALETFVENSLAGIPGLVRQHVIFDAGHRFLARVDLQFQSSRLPSKHTAENSTSVPTTRTPTPLGRRAFRQKVGSFGTSRRAKHASHWRYFLRYSLSSKQGVLPSAAKCCRQAPGWCGGTTLRHHVGTVIVRPTGGSLRGPARPRPRCSL